MPEVLLWSLKEYPLGKQAEFIDLETSPDKGIWLKTGNPDWLKITRIAWYFDWGSGNQALKIDGLNSFFKRTRGFAEDAVSQGKYLKRELTKITEATSNAEAQKDADETLAQMKDPLQSLRVTTPASTFIVGGVWKGLVGHRISVYGTTYRIIDLTVDITPYQNLKDGHDAIATFNCVLVTAKIEPDSYAPIMTPKAQVASILRKYEMKNEWKRGG